jgi:hypothetical protein
MNESLQTYFLTCDGQTREKLWQEFSRDTSVEAQTLQTMQQLHHLRYEQGHNKKEQVDSFLSAMMDGLFAVEQKKGFGGKRRVRKQMQQMGESLGLNEYEQADEKAKELFELEYQNAVSLFISLGKSDRAYRSTLLRLTQISDEMVIGKLYQDLTDIALVLPDACGLREWFAPFSRGTKAAFLTAFPGWSEKFEW